MGNECPVSKWSPATKCSAKCGLGEKIKVRIPTPQQKRDENLQKIIKLYKKLTSKRNNFNNDDEDDEDDDEENDELSDFDVMEISDSDHPCYEMELIKRETCGERNKPCENDIYGMPRMFKSSQTFDKFLSF